LPESSSSEAERSEVVLARPLPLAFLVPREGGSIVALDLAATFFPWIFSVILMGSCPKMFFFFAYYSSLSLRFSSG